MSRTRVVYDLGGLKRQIKNLKNLDMNKIGLLVKDLNFDQIAKKKNKDTSKFAAYSKSYAEAKRKRGVDLTSRTLKTKKGKPYKGESEKVRGMLKNYQIIKTIKRRGMYRVILGFSSPIFRQRAEWIVGGGKHPSKARPFIGLTKRNQNKVKRFAFQMMIRGTY